MKQILMLEPFEVSRLQKGKTLMITTPGGDEIGLQFLPAEKVQDEEGAPRLVCDECGVSEGKNGVPFRKPAALAAHKRMIHKKVKVKRANAA